MDFIMIKTINCTLKDDSKVKFSEMQVKENYYKIPNSELAKLGYGVIEATAYDGYGYHYTGTKNDTYNGWIGFNNDEKIYLADWELYKYDSWGDKVGNKYEFDIKTSINYLKVSRNYNKPTLDNFDIKYIIIQAHPDRQHPLPEPELLTNEELKLFGIGTEPEPEPQPEPPKPQPEPEPEPEEPDIINATIDGLTNIKKAIKDKETVTIIADNGYCFVDSKSTGWITVLKKDCYLNEKYIQLQDINSNYSGLITVKFIYNNKKQITKIKIESPTTLDTLVSGGYITATKIPEEKPEDKKELINVHLGWGFEKDWDVLTGYGVKEIEITAEKGYKFTKTENDGYITDVKNGIHYLCNGNFSYDGEIVNISYVKDNLITISGDLYLEDTLKGGSIKATKEGEKPPEPPKPDPETPPDPGTTTDPEYPTDYPKENLQNVYIDEYRLYKKSVGRGEITTVKEIVKFKTFKEWIDGAINSSIHGLKGDIFLIPENGYNFSLSNEDGYIIDHKGNKLYFYEMYQQAVKIPDEIYIHSRNTTYKKAKIYKGGTEKQPLEIVFYNYSKYELSMYLIDFIEQEPKNLTQPNLPPYGKILKSKIKEISVNAPVTVPKYITNLAYDSYIISDEDLSKLRDNGDLYNDLMVNTYNYPLKFNNNDLIDTQFKIASANFNADCKKFTQISTEIPIFEFDIPNIKGVESVEIYPIYSNKILIDYSVVQGKHIKGISVYDCITNTNVLKILANDVLVDYFDYNIQSEIPINYNINRLQVNGTIAKRIPLFKSFVILKSTEYMTLDEKKQNLYKGDILKINSNILKKEYELLENLFKMGIYINEEGLKNE